MGGPSDLLGLSSIFFDYDVEYYEIKTVYEFKKKFSWSSYSLLWWSRKSPATPRKYYSFCPIFVTIDNEEFFVVKNVVL